MGEAFTSVTDDPYSAWWNPASLAGLEGPALVATYNDSFENVVHQYLSAAYPLRYGSTLGVSVSRLGVAPFQGYDAQGVRSGSVDSVDLAVEGAYGRTLYKDEIERPVLNVGAGLKLISERLNGASANTAAADLGAVYYLRPDKYWMSEAPAQEYRMALTVRNLGPGLKYDRLSSPLPLTVTLGGSWHSHPGGNSSLVLSFDQSVSKDEKYWAAVGAEYTAFQLLSFRAGYRAGQAVGSGVRVGVGFRLSMMDIDYSMSPYGELGAMHKLGVSMRLGEAAYGPARAARNQRVESAKLIARKEKIEELELFAQDYLNLASKDLAARRYVSASANIRKAFNLEPKLKAGEWGRKSKRLDDLVRGLKLETIPERELALSKDAEQPNAAVEAIGAYLEGKDLKALLLAHAALGANRRGNPLFEELLYLTSDLVKIHVRRDEILPRVALVKEKLRKAAKGFYVQEFDAAARECEEVTVMDEENKIAWIRLGSAYFMMGDKEKAKKAYQRVLALDPGDEVTKKFMQSQGWITGAEGGGK